MSFVTWVVGLEPRLAPPMNVGTTSRSDPGAHALDLAAAAMRLGSDTSSPYQVRSRPRKLEQIGERCPGEAR